ncbi:helix-hairpin-helix domain-containing protein [Microvirga sp. STR05]|uniref:Helix-hairpin-helix domain-containing protein n=1 Tax=Hymenobacter duratus TaxID=2771356 RepID=A0ABR8JJG8_9BACT|nr:helix-hairpin-helix domain-containing protein [Hymenobacter duratus]MBD2715771.1 helix-hairpin-helix domain-containing protein [Hymenobacter duratus]MBR7950682.1 helix-hairpin-helix domain-containing protein [Microvirga sp. STR05]
MLPHTKTGCAKWRVAAVLALLLPLAAQAQEYVRPAADLDRLTQELFAEIQSDQVPYEDLYETLLQYYQTPLSLNSASREDLRGLLLLSENQISKLLEYRQQRGPLLSLYELQAVPSFDLRSIYRIAPFVTAQAAGGANALRGPLWQRVFKEDNNALFMRYERVLQTRKGYTTAPTDSLGQGPTRYLGSPDKLMLRYRVSHAKDFSLGITAEKDAGEQLLWNPTARTYGPDFLSAHFVLQERGKLRTLAVGDYQLQFGQGLLLSSGLQVGKGAETITTLRRSSVGVRPYSSILESTFFRGAAATVSLSPTVRATGFVSRKRVDANVQQAADSLAEFDEFSSGFLLTGFHRTASELANRQTLRETVAGGNLGYTSRSGHLSAGLTAVDTHFDKAIQRRPELYNQYEFRGTHNLALGAHYSYVRGNVLLFGETARSSSGGWGTVNGVLASLAPTIDVSALVRHYSRDFHTLYGNALSENTRNINESGLYLGLKLRPVARWEVSAYYDQFRFPWLKYGVGAPSAGHDWLARVAYSPTKTSLLYAQIRSRQKDYDASTDQPAPLPVPTTRQSLLLYYDANPTLILGLRTRVQASRYREDNGPWQRGYVLAQDASVAVGRRLRLTARYAIFDTDSYDTRQYVFEQDVLYAFSVPALSGQGTRIYGIAEINCSRHLTFWLRLAETHYRYQNTVGSGLEEIQGPRRTEFKAQVRYRF